MSIFDLDPARINSERDLISFGRGEILELCSWSFYPERRALEVRLGDMELGLVKATLGDWSLVRPKQNSSFSPLPLIHHTPMPITHNLTSLIP